MSDEFLVLICSVCLHNELEPVINLPDSPIADAFSFDAKDSLNAKRYPLVVNICHNCGHLQLSHHLPTKLLFKNYTYKSSNNQSLVDHFQKYAQNLSNKFSLDKNSFVIDIGSNDGTFLKNFSEEGIRTLGIDPADDIAKLAIENGVDTINDIFCLRVAKEISQSFGKADLISANNVFAHISEVREIVEAVSFLLKDSGTFVFEVSYAPDIINKKLFDTIYHEHLFYYCLAPIVRLFKDFKLQVFDFDRISSKGGSIRVYVKKDFNIPVPNKVGLLLKQEESIGFQSVELYRAYNASIERQKLQTLEFFEKIVKRQNSIIAYGASATVTTLVNTLEIENYFDYIVDDNHIKNGSYLPGTSLQIKNKVPLGNDIPSAICILAWNYSTKIIAKNKGYSDKGGTFIVPMPNIEIF